MKPFKKLNSLLLTTLLISSSGALADEEMSLETKKSSTTSFDVPALPTGEFSASEEKQRRAKALQIAKRAQERENAKARSHNSKLSGKSKRKVAGLSRNHTFKSKIRHSRDKMVSDSDF